jgi:large subunit ribosomal protein L32
MAVPKKRRSYTRRHLRRANHALDPVSLQVCPECDKALPPHRVCEKGFSCGMYWGAKSSKPPTKSKKAAPSQPSA